MTNKELIKRFFKGRVKGDEESYGFSIKLSKYLKRHVDELALYSKTSQFPFAIKAPKNYFLIAAPPEEPRPWIRAEHYNPPTQSSNKNLGSHSNLTITIAKQMKIRFILSPLADENYFQTYMENEINSKLTILAKKLKAKSSRVNFDYYPPYLELIKTILTLHEGENLLKLPKNQVPLIDGDEFQSMWRWLIKENPVKEERELLMKTYTLSKFMAPK